MIKLQCHPTIKKAYAHVAITILLTLKFVIELLAVFAEHMRVVFDVLANMDYEQLEENERRLQEDYSQVAERGD